MIYLLTLLLYCITTIYGCGVFVMKVILFPVGVMSRLKLQRYSVVKKYSILYRLDTINKMLSAEICSLLIINCFQNYVEVCKFLTSCNQCKRTTVLPEIKV